MRENQIRVFGPSNMSSTSVEQLHRYAIASELARGKVVLEIGFGEGYGSSLVVQTARQVVGMDVTPGLVKYARTKHRNGKLFIVGGKDTNIPLTTGCVGLVMSFEVIEPLKQGESMMAEIARVLRPGGIVIISSSHKHEYCDVLAHQNSSQLNSHCMSECESLLRTKFRHVAVFAQGIALGSYIVPLVNKPLRSDASCTSVAGDFIPGQKESAISSPCYVFAIGSNEALPTVRVGLFGTEGLPLDTLQMQLADTLKAVAEKERTIAELNMRLLAT
jgi:ubiquinone/menaquinone biosynthesis C-methylase UbiE